MSNYYEHKQTGYIIMVLLAITLIILSYLLATNGFNAILIPVFLVIGVCLKIFSTLKVSIDNEALDISFGSGIIAKKLILDEIETCEIVKNPWYYGWGIHLTPKGWLYNVSGFHAVQIKMMSGKKYLIGTDEPNRLRDAIIKCIEPL